MHTLKILAGGFLLLALCLGLARAFGPGTPEANLGLGVKIFAPLWLIGAGANMYVGVARAGYSVADEAPVFALVFLIPTAMAWFIWWRATR